MFDAAELDNLQAVHDGNIDIHDDDIRMQGIDLGQRLHAVPGFAHYFTAVGLPVKEPLEALTDHDLIIHQKHTQLFHFTFSSSNGSSRCAVTPPPSFSVYERPYSRPQSSLIRFCTFSMPMLLPVSLGACLA